jgi:hypothetical protein
MKRKGIGGALLGSYILFLNTAGALLGYDSLAIFEFHSRGAD